RPGRCASSARQRETMYRIEPHHLGNLRSRRSAHGFSTLELLVVLAIVIIMIAATVPSLIQSQRTYATEDAAKQVIDFLRSGYERSLTQRQVMRVKIDRGSGMIEL